MRMHLACASSASPPQRHSSSGTPGSKRRFHPSDHEGLAKPDPDPGGRMPAVARIQKWRTRSTDLRTRHRFILKIVFGQALGPQGCRSGRSEKFMLSLLDPGGTYKDWHRFHFTIGATHQLYFLAVTSAVSVAAFGSCICVADQMNDWKGLQQPSDSPTCKHRDGLVGSTHRHRDGPECPRVLAQLMTETLVIKSGVVAAFGLVLISSSAALAEQRTVS